MTFSSAWRSPPFRSSRANKRSPASEGVSSFPNATGLRVSSPLAVAISAAIEVEIGDQRASVKFAALNEASETSAPAKVARESVPASSNDDFLRFAREKSVEAICAPLISRPLRSRDLGKRCH